MINGEVRKYFNKFRQALPLPWHLSESENLAQVLINHNCVPFRTCYSCGEVLPKKQCLAIRQPVRQYDRHCLPYQHTDIMH